jgi:carbon monoxide dehydrogenase subunit G
MDMQGSRHLAVSQQQAWDALNDPEVLKICIPGCDKVEATGENQYALGMAVKIGPVSARFNGKIQLTDVLPPNSYPWVRRAGQGRGFGKARPRSTWRRRSGAGCGSPTAQGRWAARSPR